jgi:hypothetical protein
MIKHIYFIMAKQTIKPLKTFISYILTISIKIIVILF